MNLALNTSFVHALQGGWTASNAASAERVCFIFFLTISIPNTIEAPNTQNSSVRCSLKENSLEQGFDSLSPNNRQTGCRKSPQSLRQAEQKDWIQRLLVLRNESFSLCLFSSPFQSWVCLHCPLWLPGMPNYDSSNRIGCVASQKQKAKEHLIRLTKSPCLSVLSDVLKSEARGLHLEPSNSSPFKCPNDF